jgi:DNA damage-binding protein 2
VALCGRYISDTFDGTKLHPIDIIDVDSGALVAEVFSKGVSTICTVNKFHPTRNVIGTGTAGLEGRGGGR